MVCAFCQKNGFTESGGECAHWHIYSLKKRKDLYDDVFILKPDDLAMKGYYAVKETFEEVFKGDKEKVRAQAITISRNWRSNELFASLGYLLQLESLHFDAVDNLSTSEGLQKKTYGVKVEPDVAKLVSAIKTTLNRHAKTTRDWINVAIFLEEHFR